MSCMYSYKLWVKGCLEDSTLLLVHVPLRILDFIHHGIENVGFLNQFLLDDIARESTWDIHYQVLKMK